MEGMHPGARVVAADILSCGETVTKVQAVKRQIIQRAGRLGGHGHLFGV